MTNNLDLAQVAPSQNNKETTINDQAGQLDAALTDRVDVSLTDASSPLSLTDAQALRCMVLKFTGTNPGSDFAVHCPTNKKLYVLWNTTAETVTFKTPSGTGVTLAAVDVDPVLSLVCCDGTNVLELASGGGASDFLSLTDTPDNYSGQALKALRVNAGATGLEYAGGAAADGAGRFKGARASRSLTNQTVSTTGAWTPLIWDTEDYDTDGFYDPANPSRLTIPAGVTRVRLYGAAQVDSADQIDDNQFTFSKNGENEFSGASVSAMALGGYSNPPVVMSSGVIDVVEGDYFEFRCFISQSFQLESDRFSSWFEIEVLEAAGEPPIDLAMFIAGVHGDDALMAQMVMTRVVTLPAGLIGSQAYAQVAATAETVLDVQKNGSNVGTITFAASGQTGTFAMASETTLSAGDRLAIVNESPADATLAGVSLTFAGTRGS
jgi:hypothetical protein